MRPNETGYEHSIAACATRTFRKCCKKGKKKSTRRSIFFATEVAVQSNRING